MVPGNSCSRLCAEVMLIEDRLVSVVKSSRALAAAAACLLAVSACSAAETDRAEGSVTRSVATEEQDQAQVAESASATQSVQVTVPDDWYEIAPKEGFDYQYLWEGNDWDDILAQTFAAESFTFSPDFFVGLLRPSFGGNATIEVREDVADVSGHPAITIDIAYDSGSFTSFTYVDVDGQLWEFTVNALTPEGLRRGEEINATAEFTTGT